MFSNICSSSVHAASFGARVAVQSSFLAARAVVAVAPLLLNPNFLALGSMLLMSYLTYRAGQQALEKGKELFQQAQGDFDGLMKHVAEHVVVASQGAHKAVSEVAQTAIAVQSAEERDPENKFEPVVSALDVSDEDGQSLSSLHEAATTLISDEAMDKLTAAIVKVFEEPAAKPSVEIPEAAMRRWERSQRQHWSARDFANAVRQQQEEDSRNSGFSFLQ
jgi:hypothetical protein